MSAFRNIRILPYHGDRAAVISWSMEPDLTGDVYIAYSESGIGPWTVRNSGDPVAAEIGTYYDTELYIERGSTVGYYKLMLESGSNTYVSEIVGIFTDVMRKEYGIVSKIIRSEYQAMRARDGYPVWYCIPKTEGALDPAYDPDTLEINRPPCQTPTGQSGKGLPYQGGFHPPILTWVSPIEVRKQTIQDSETGSGTTEKDGMTLRMLPFPNPVRKHMLVDPATDRRYLISGIKPFFLRGVIPVAYETVVDYITPKDDRYKFQMPTLDTKDYRNISYWA